MNIDTIHCIHVYSIQVGNFGHEILRLITSKSRFRRFVYDNLEIVCSNDLETAEHHSCMCDSHYAMNLGKMWSDEKFDFNLWYSKKNANRNSADVFDRETICVEKNKIEDYDLGLDYDDSLDCLSVFQSFMKLK